MDNIEPTQTDTTTPQPTLKDTYPYNVGQSGPLAPLTPLNPAFSLDAIKGIQPLKSVSDIHTVLGNKDPLYNPIVDPLFNEDDAMGLLLTFRKAQVANIVTNLMTTGPSRFADSPDAGFKYNRNAIPAEYGEKSGWGDTFAAAGILNNWTARAMANSDRYGAFKYPFVGPGASMLLNAIFGPTPSSDINTDEWFADKKNRNYLSNLPGHQGSMIVQNWANGDYRDIHNSADFFTVLGMDIRDNAARDTMANATGPAQLLMGIPAALADPIAWGTGEIALSGAAALGRAAIGATEVANAAGKTTGVLGKVGQAVASGTAFSVAQEAGLHTTDNKRTLDESIDNIASNILLNSIAAGVGHMIFARANPKAVAAKTPEVPTVENVTKAVEAASIPPTPVATPAPAPETPVQFPTGLDIPKHGAYDLSQIDAEATANLTKQFDKKLGSLKVEQTPDGPHTLSNIDDEVSQSLKAQYDASRLPPKAPEWLPDIEQVQKAVSDHVQSIEAPEAFHDFLTVTQEAHASANDAAARSQLVFKGYEPGVAGHTNGYEDYLPYFGKNKDKLPGIVDLISKNLNNSVPLYGDLTVHAASYTENPKLAMFYQKLYNALLPSKAIAEGLAPKSIPFETVDAFIRAHGTAMSAAIDRSFKEFINVTDPTMYNKFMFSDFAGKELWPKELIAKYQAWNEIFDRSRAETMLEIYGNRSTDIPTAEMPKTDIKTDPRLAQLYDTLNIKALDDVPAAAKAKLEAMLQPIIDTDLIKFGEIRGNAPDSSFLNPDMSVTYVKNKMAHDAIHSSVVLPQDIAPAEFVRFWNEARNPNPSTPWDLNQIVSDWNARKPNVLTPHDLVAPNQQTINRMVQNFYNDEGGYVAKERLSQVLGLARDLPTDRLVRMDAQSTIKSTARVMQNFELAKQLNEYLKEAISFDPELAAAGGTDLINHFQDLNAYKTFAGEGQTNILGRGQLDVNNVPKDLSADEAAHYNKNASKLLSGLLDDTKAWNQQALKLLEGSMGNDPLASKVINDLRKRADLGDQPNAPASSINRNILSASRNMHAATSMAGTVRGISTAVQAVALSPFKQTFIETMRDFMTDVSATAKAGKPIGDLLEHVDLINQGLQDVQINRTGQFDPRTFDPNVSSTAGQKLASIQENTIGTLARNVVLGETALDAQKTYAILSTVQQLTSPKGLFPALQKAIGDLETGKSWQEALKANNVPEWYANTAMRYFDADGVNTVADLIKNNSTKDVSFGRRFYVDKFLGEQRAKILSLPEGATPEQKVAMENLGMLVNDMASHEKMLNPTWGDDMFGENSAAKQLGSFWLRNNTALFNRAIIGQTGKESAARLGYMASTALTGTAVAFLRAFIAGPGEVDKLFAEMQNNFPAFLADRVGWSGITGGVGGRGLSAAANIVSGKGLTSAAIGSTPVATANSVATGLRNLYSGLTNGNITKSQADSTWRLMSAAGLANDTTGAQALGRFGRAIGVYGSENNAPDVQRWMYDQMGVKQQNKDNK